MARDRSGLLIEGRVRVDACIGEGGMASVWRGVDADTGAEVAVKFMSDALLGNANLRARFAREGRAADGITSPHVVRTLGCSEIDDGTPYLMMELCRGECLRTMLTRIGKLPAESVVGIVEQLAAALEAAHAAGVVHRDIKPENVFLVAPDGFVKVLDFGIARRHGVDEPVLTMAGTILGTPDYMSPEQINDTASALPAFDTWAMAVVAYEAITGTLPFAGEELSELFMAISKGNYTPPSRLGCAPALDAVFAAAFALDKSARITAPAAFAAALGKAIVREGERRAPRRPTLTLAVDLAISSLDADDEATGTRAPAAAGARHGGAGPAQAPRALLRNLRGALGRESDRPGPRGPAVTPSDKPPAPTIDATLLMASGAAETPAHESGGGSARPVPATTDSPLAVTVGAAPAHIAPTLTLSPEHITGKQRSSARLVVLVAVLVALALGVAIVVALGAA